LISGRSALRAAAVAVVVVAADQATKALVRADVDLGSRDGVLPGVELVHVRNRGVAFGLFADGGLVLILVGVASVSALLVFFATHSRRPLVWLPTGLLLGGAAGNLIDRLDRGYVTDFIDLPAWPAFNVADICITFGVLSLLYVLEGPPRHADPD
jgi:signal peptidase II